MKCYNCGKELTKQTKTKEHIPAQAYFVGYGDEYKLNRITVPACYPCNQKYSKIDNEIRDALGVINESDEKQKELSRKAAKSILQNIKGRTNRLHFDESGNIEAVEFNYNDFKTLAIKDFKGLFYKKYGFPLPKNWKVEIIADFENNSNLDAAKAGLLAYLNKDTQWSKSGHLDIFSYKLKALTPDENGDITDGKNIENTKSFASVQVYHDRISFIVVAARKKYLNKLEKGDIPPSKKKKSKRTNKEKNKIKMENLKRKLGKKRLCKNKRQQKK
ncbi:hypothetical protein [Aureispira sp. CCB-QB1]|uniref:hypothetical protein n=1 Tax=Aureispira sp. CCB-QB1 TaxID=1313421 RepID=UPI0012DD7E64|nr:hypothetical protein [Aureispira sp. CCB-QB1]